MPSRMRRSIHKLISQRFRIVCFSPFAEFVAWAALVLSVATPQCAWSASQPTTQTPSQEISLDKGFRNPPTTARPWVFWMWLRVDTTPAAITKDLEEMHAKGIEGAIVYDSGVGGALETSSKMALQGKEYREVKTSEYAGAHYSAIPADPVRTWEPRSLALLRFAAKEAARVKIKLVLSVGLAGTSGPIDITYGQQQLVWSETSVGGPGLVNRQLSVPETVIPYNHIWPSRKMKAAYPAADTGFASTPIAVLAVPVKDGFGPEDVIDISSRMDASGHLHWQSPGGQWKIMRFAYMPTGAKNVWGYFTDGMSAEALDKTWASTMGKLLPSMSPVERTGLYGVEDDSWEAGPSSWTPLFATKFRQLRGYDLVPWLPALVGMQMKAANTTEAVLRDYRRTVADLIASNHYAHLGELARQNHLVSYSEASGPNSVQLDPMLSSKGVDVAAGEFWIPSPHRPTPDVRFLLRDSASANHIYGKPITGCESFTSVGPAWEESFFDLKNSADQAFTDGCNLNLIHNFSQSPSVTAKPGYAYFAGTYYSRNVTWWEQTPAFNTYLGRSSFLLQQGLFVADALYYRGEGIGQIEQRKTRPALPAEGYDHDNINLDALVHRLSVKDGRLVLPDGMSYRILVLPGEPTMAITALKKIAELVRAGAVVVGRQPREVAGLEKRVASGEDFASLASKLWGEGFTDSKNHTHFIRDEDPAAVLQRMKVSPDLEHIGLSHAGELDWIHRRSRNTDIYFVASRWDATEKVDCTFRVSGKRPELWDPVTGEIRDARAFTQHDGKTTVPLEFNPRGSIFVIFRKPIPDSSSGQQSSNYPQIITKAEISGAWNVSFDPKWGGPASVVFDSLVDWTKRPESSIQNYSGTAMYRTTLPISFLPSGNRKLLLDLGEVHEVAEVRLNGIDLGVVWTKPMRVDITRAAKLGDNRLEVTVVNLWPNRLKADESLSIEKRLTETNLHKFGAMTPSLPSGLLGPVKLEQSSF